MLFELIQYSHYCTNDSFLKMQKVWYVESTEISMVTLGHNFEMQSDNVT